MKFLLILIPVMALAVLYFLPSQNTLVKNNAPNNIPSIANAIAEPVNSQPELTALLGTAKQLTLDSIDTERLSLKGTDIDGAYPVAKNGHLLAHISIRERFEYFLSLNGELTLQDIMALIRSDIKKQLTPPAQHEALALLESYIAYKYALKDLANILGAESGISGINGKVDITQYRAQLSQLREIRRDYFNGDITEAFFGFDETYDDFTLDSLTIKHDGSLTADEKSAQLLSLEKNLPEDILQVRTETQSFIKVASVIKTMEDNGATEADLFNYNSQQFGQAAAERLQSVSRSRQGFQRRVNDFISQKSAIKTDASLSLQSQQAQIEILKQAHFSAQEQRRLPALELMAQSRDN